MVIYISGCLTCGRNGRQINRVMKYAREAGLDVEIKVSENTENRAEHVQYLEQAGLPKDSYTAIVVENGKVTRLREWNT